MIHTGCTEHLRQRQSLCAIRWKSAMVTRVHAVTVLR